MASKRQVSKLASKLGSVLGSVSSEAKAEAARLNGQLGGRPRNDGLRTVGVSHANGIHNASVLLRRIQEFLKLTKTLLDDSSKASLVSAAGTVTKLQNQWRTELKKMRAKK